MKEFQPFDTTLLDHAGLNRHAVFNLADQFDRMIIRDHSTASGHMVRSIGSIHGLNV